MSVCELYFLKSIFKLIILFNFGCAGSWLLPMGFSLFAASGACSLVAVPGLLTVVASLVAEFKPQ